MSDPFTPLDPEITELLDQSFKTCERIASKLRDVARDLQIFADAIEGHAASLILKHNDLTQEPVAYKPPGDGASTKRRI